MGGTSILAGLLVLVVASLVTASAHDYIKIDGFFLWHSRDHRRAPPRFSTKTAYRLVVGSQPFHHDLPYTCHAEHVNFVIRHGTRYPSKGDIKDFDKVANIINTYANPENLAPEINLELPLKSRYSVKLAKLLTSVGDKEHYRIGRQMARSFPGVLPRERGLESRETFNPIQYSFTSTCKERTIRGAYATSLGFLHGYGDVGRTRLQPISVTYKDCDKDPILRYYKDCPKYEKEIEDNDKVLVEKEKFLKGPEIAKVVHKVRKRLGLESKKEIDAKVVGVIYKACAFGIAIFKEEFSTGWCSLLDIEDLKAFEYVDDLENFYTQSTGHKINYEISCTLLQDIFNGIRAAAGKKVKYNSYKAVIRVGHSQTILPLLALMGIKVNNETLTASNFRRMATRKFRSSLLVPFAANLGFVLFKCGQSKRFMVQVYLNERLVRIPCCKEASSCPLDRFLQCYAEIVDNCNHAELCKL